PVRAGEVVPVLLERGGRVRRADVRFGPGRTLARQVGPDAPVLSLFLFGTLLPARLTLLCFLGVGWVVLWRRPNFWDAQLCFLVAIPSALSFSTAYTRPSVYPMPLRWLAEDWAVPAGWIVAFALHFAVVAAPLKALPQRRWQRIVAANYLVVLAVTSLALLATLAPAMRPSWQWLQQRFLLLYWLPAWVVFWVRLLHSALQA